MDVIDELIKFHRLEKWHEREQSDEELRAYFSIVVAKDRIRFVDDGVKMLGYVESWRITFEQFGRKICHEPILVDKEDIEHGPIAYVANTHILEGYRFGDVYKRLVELFTKQNFSAKYFVGEATRKKHSPVKVFNRKDFLNKIKEGATNHE